MNWLGQEATTTTTKVQPSEDALRNVKDERPGTIAVDDNGDIFIAEGGDDDISLAPVANN